MTDTGSDTWILDTPLPLIEALLASDWRVIGPQVRDRAIVYEPMTSASALPQGVIDRQAPGSYGLEMDSSDRWFDYVVGPQNWKRWLFPPHQKLWSAKREADGFSVTQVPFDWPQTAFFGIRPCDLAALEILDRVLGPDGADDPAYQKRRADTLIVVVQCARSGPTCFCASMNTGPHATGGYDIALTELEDGKICMTAGTPRGLEITRSLDAEPAIDEHLLAARSAGQAAARQQVRSMPAGIADTLKSAPESPQWDEVASRCLACANCTLACPTCFCTDVEDTNDLSGDNAERTRVWDSCFNLDFSYIHGGEVRTSIKSRYRQWMTHKLSSWHDQFGTSGCVGCGRCIAWCPVGIDITEEAKTFDPTPEEANP